MKKRIFRAGNKHYGNIQARHHPFLALDVENDPVTGNFICASLYGERKNAHGTKKIIDLFFTDRLALMDWIQKEGWSGKDQKTPFNLVGHNIVYDLAFIDEIVNDSTRLQNGNSFYTAKIKETNVKVFDTANYARGSLADWIGYLDMEKTHNIKKIPFTDEQPPSELTTELKERNRADAVATWILANFLEDFAVKECNCPFKLTVGALSFLFWERHCASDLWIRDDEDLMEFERLSYRGGRVEVFRSGEQATYQYDVHKMYLSIMKEELLPNPCKVRFYDNDYRFNETYKNGFPFIADVEVYVPKQRIPPLPYVDKETGKLIFPTGRFRGVFTSVGLREAVDKHNVKILKVYRYSVYYEEKKYLSKFAEWVWEKQNYYKAEGNIGMYQMLKVFGNALYGKFGQKSGGTSWVKLEDYKGKDIEGLDGLERDGVLYVQVTEPRKWSSHSFPVIAAFITAYGRRKWLRKAKEHEDFVVYGDTDSIHLDIRVPNKPKNEEGLGNWGAEYNGEAHYQQYYRPKHYGDRKKGVPKKAQLIGKTNTTLVYIYDKPLRRAESIRKGEQENKWVTIIKRISLLDDKRVWKGNESVAIHLS